MFNVANLFSVVFIFVLFLVLNVACVSGFPLLIALSFFSCSMSLWISAYMITDNSNASCVINKKNTISGRNHLLFASTSVVNVAMYVFSLLCCSLLVFLLCFLFEVAFLS